MLLWFAASILSAWLVILWADLLDLRPRTPWGHPDPRVQGIAWTVLLCAVAACWALLVIDSPLPVAVYRACQRWALPC
jgi:hypothetical protein